MHELWYLRRGVHLFKYYIQKIIIRTLKQTSIHQNFTDSFEVHQASQEMTP